MESARDFRNLESVPGAEPRQVRTQERTPALTGGWRLRALEVHLAIERHEQLHSLHPPVACRERPAIMRKFVGQVLDRVAQDFKGAPRLRGDMPAVVGAQAACESGPCGIWSQEAGCRGNCHAITPHEGFGRPSLLPWEYGRMEV